MYGTNWRKLSLMLKPDDGAGTSGGSQTTTTTPATTTGGGQDNNTQAGGAGAATGAATNQAATNTNTTTADADKAPAPKFTDDDMARAKSAWKAEADRKANEAAEAAKQEEAIKQGQAAEIAATRLKTIHDLEGRIARMEPVLNERLDELTKGWPQSILAKKPTEGGYDARLQWYENSKDIADDYIKALEGKQKETVQSYGGTGFQPGGQGAGSNVRPVDAYMNRTYAQKKQ